MAETAQEKMYYIAKALLSHTREDRVHWDESDVRTRFVTAIASGAVLVDREEDTYHLRVQNEDGQVIESIATPPGFVYPSFYQPKGEKNSLRELLASLYEVVRRRVWGVDETLDSVLQELQ